MRRVIHLLGELFGVGFLLIVGFYSAILLILGGLVAIWGLAGGLVVLLVVGISIRSSWIRSPITTSAPSIASSIW